jgi:hypothetical protein
VQKAKPSRTDPPKSNIEKVMEKQMAYLRESVASVPSSISPDDKKVLIAKINLSIQYLKNTLDTLKPVRTNVATTVSLPIHRFMPGASLGMLQDDHLLPLKVLLLTIAFRQSPDSTSTDQSFKQKSSPDFLNFGTSSTSIIPANIIHRIIVATSTAEMQGLQKIVADIQQKAGYNRPQAASSLKKPVSLANKVIPPNPHPLPFINARANNLTPPPKKIVKRVVPIPTTNTTASTTNTTPVAIVSTTTTVVSTSTDDTVSSSTENVVPTQAIEVGSTTPTQIDVSSTTATSSSATDATTSDATTSSQ